MVSNSDFQPHCKIFEFKIPTIEKTVAITFIWLFILPTLHTWNKLWSRGKIAKDFQKWLCFAEPMATYFTKGKNLPNFFCLSRVLFIPCMLLSCQEKTGECNNPLKFYRTVVFFLCAEEIKDLWNDNQFETTNKQI